MATKIQARHASVSARGINGSLGISLSISYASSAAAGRTMAVATVRLPSHGTSAAATLDRRIRPATVSSLTNSTQPSAVRRSSAV
jgi:hypothetical protein